MIYYGLPGIIVINTVPLSSVLQPNACFSHVFHSLNLCTWDFLDRNIFQLWLPGGLSAKLPGILGYQVRYVSELQEESIFFINQLIVINFQRLYSWVQLYIVPFLESYFSFAYIKWFPFCQIFFPDILYTLRPLAKTLTSLWSFQSSKTWLEYELE